MLVEVAIAATLLTAPTGPPEGLHEALHGAPAILEDLAEATAPSDIPTNAITGNVTPAGGSIWDTVAACEWNEDPAAGPTGWATTTTGNGYYFALQFSPGTWLANGGTQAELDAGVAPSRARLIEVAENVLASQGPGAWPNCFP